MYKSFFKRFFDILISFISIFAFSPFLLIIAIAIKIDSRGPVFFKQKRYNGAGKNAVSKKFKNLIGLVFFFCVVFVTKACSCECLSKKRLVFKNIPKSFFNLLYVFFEIHSLSFYLFVGRYIFCAFRRKIYNA